MAPRRRKTVEWLRPSASAAPTSERASAIALTSRNSSQSNEETMMRASDVALRRFSRRVKMRKSNMQKRESLPRRRGDGRAR
jgi:hypothetical protein